MTKKYVNVSTDTFFTDGEWEIHVNPLQHNTMNPAVSRVVHYCKKPQMPVSRGGNRIKGPEYCHVWANLNGSLHCPKCGELMPSSVQTLWTLQNFDIDFSDFVVPAPIQRSTYG